MSCPQCHDRLSTLLGRLGYLVWLRCRACGTEYSLPVDSFSADELDEMNEATEVD
jgi:hypothetical protein